VAKELEWQCVLADTKWMPRCHCRPLDRNLGCYQGDPRVDLSDLVAVEGWNYFQALEVPKAEVDCMRGTWRLFLGGRDGSRVVKQ